MSHFRNKYQITLWVTTEEELAIIHLFQSKGWQYINSNIYGPQPREHIQENDSTATIGMASISHPGIAEKLAHSHLIKPNDTLHVQCFEPSVSVHRNATLKTNHRQESDRTKVQGLIQGSYDEQYFKDPKVSNIEESIVTDTTIQIHPEINLNEEKVSENPQKVSQFNSREHLDESLKHVVGDQVYTNEQSVSRTSGADVELLLLETPLKQVSDRVIHVPTNKSDTIIINELGDTSRTDHPYNLQSTESSKFSSTIALPVKEAPSQLSKMGTSKYGIDNIVRISDSITVSSHEIKGSTNGEYANDNAERTSVKRCDMTIESSTASGIEAHSVGKTEAEYEIDSNPESESSIVRRESKRLQVVQKKRFFKIAIKRKPYIARKVRNGENEKHGAVEVQREIEEDPILVDEDKNLNEMSILIVNHSNKHPFICCMCNMDFIDIEIFRQHARDLCLLKLQNVDKSVGYQCKDCLAHYKQAFTLVRHRLSQVCQPGKTKKVGSFLECGYCGRTYPRRRQTDYTLHIMHHQNNKPYVCEVCGKRFIRWTSLRNHKRMHTGERPYKCGYCPRTFTTVSLQRNHELWRHIEVPRSFICEKCGATFKFSGGLSIHMKEVHTEEKKFCCTVCGKQFKRKGAVTRHMKIHSNMRDKKCSICGKTFNCQADLNKHAKIHIHSVFCEDCGKGFSSKRSLLLHSQVHTGEKPFACTACTNKYSTIGNFKKHMRALHPELLV